MKYIALILLAATLTGCVSGKYIGPSIGIQAGYKGVSVNVTLFGNQPDKPVDYGSP